VPDLVFDGWKASFDHSRNNTLDFMQASSKLYGIARELKCFTERTCRFSINHLGFSFEGHRACPTNIIKAAMQHVDRVKVVLEIDLDHLVELPNYGTLLAACNHVSRNMMHLNRTEKRLQRYDIDIHMVDSGFVADKPRHNPSTHLSGAHIPHDGHGISLSGSLREMLQHLVRVQNIRVGNVLLLSQPLTHHTKWNCSLPPITPGRAQRAQRRWNRVH
jgi:hypothetical protein